MYLKLLRFYRLRGWGSASKSSFPRRSSLNLSLCRQKAAAAAPVSSLSQGLQIPSDLQGHKTHLLLLFSCFNQPLQLGQLFYNSPSMRSCTRLLQSICSLVSDCILHVLWDGYSHVQHRCIQTLGLLNCSVCPCSCWRYKVITSFYFTVCWQQRQPYKLRLT